LRHGRGFFGHKPLIKVESTRAEVDLVDNPHVGMLNVSQFSLQVENLALAVNEALSGYKGPVHL
jgi:hypothetical protein